MSETKALDWRTIQQDARTQALEAERVTLELGQPIAWATTTRSGVTDGVSSLHRVGLPIGNAAHTTCGQAIPAPVLWLALSPVLPLTLLPCGFCEAAHAERDHEIAA